MSTKSKPCGATNIHIKNKQTGNDQSGEWKKIKTWSLSREGKLLLLHSTYIFCSRLTLTLGIACRHHVVLWHRACLKRPLGETLLSALIHLRPLHCNKFCSPQPDEASCILMSLVENRTIKSKLNYIETGASYLTFFKFLMRQLHESFLQ